MKSGWSNTVTSAVVGGIVGGVVAYICMAFSPSNPPQSAFPESIEKLKVGELIVSDKMLLWKDGEEDATLLIQNGGILAKTRVIAQQLCGNAVLANCVLTTPDNPMGKLEECAIFTEMGSSPAEGGMLTVRSPNGGNILANQGVTTGLAYTISYTNQGAPVCVLRSNDTGKRFLGQFMAPPPGLENLTALLIDPAAQQQQQPSEPSMEMSQQMAPGSPMNPSQGMQLPPGNPLQGNSPGVPTPGLDQQAMAPTAVPR